MARKALKNYATKISAARSAAEVQEMLAARGATGVLMEYDPDGSGRIESISFKIKMAAGNELFFRLPTRWKKTMTALQRDRVPRANDEDYVYRVAWRNVKDWVDAQMTMYDLEMVNLSEIFLPYLIGNNNRTLYDNVADQPGLLLGIGSG